MITTVVKFPGKIFLLLFPLISFVHAAEWYRILEKTDQKLIIEIDAPAVEVDSTTADDRQNLCLRAGDWPTLKKEAQYPVPFQNLLLHLSGRDAHLTILHSETSGSKTVDLQRNRRDRPSAEADSAFESGKAIASPAASLPFAALNYLGQDAGGYLWNLLIYPYRYDPVMKTVTHVHSMRLQVAVSTAGENNHRIMYPDRRASLFADVTLGAAAGWARKPTAAATSESPYSNYCMLYVEQDGIYRITGSDLQAAGLNLLTVDIKKLRLTCGGKDVPIYVQGWKDGQFHQNDYFEFWGEYYRGAFQSRSADMYQDPFSPTNVYWLSWQGTRGQWMAEESAGVIASQADDLQKPYSYYHTVHVEKDDYFNRLYGISKADSLRDHWFFTPLIGSGRKVDFPFGLEYPDERSSLPLQLRVMMSGLSDKNEAPHQVAIFLNNRYFFSGRGEGQGIMDLGNGTDVLLSGADLNHGENTLTVINEFDPAQSDFVLMNWFEITYPRLYRAHNGLIKFTIPPDYNPGRFLFHIDGFADNDIDVYKLGTSLLVGGSKQQVTDFTGFKSIRISFEDVVHSRETVYVAAAQSAKKKPSVIRVVDRFPVFSAEAGLDYVVITLKKFISTQSLQDLVALRQSQGYRVGIIDIQDVFDAFDHGRRNSYALKSFLTWAYDHWPLQYVLLVGDGCYLRRPVEGDTLDMIPVHYRQTVSYGATAADSWYGLLAGDDEIPDVHIGRLPVRNESQLRRIVDKIIHHETQPERSDWRNRLLFLGGDGQFFRDKGIGLALKAPRDYSTAMLFTTKDKTMDEDPFYGGTGELLDYFARGCAVVNFHGHGGGAIWSDNGLFKLEDVALMNNLNKYPLILSMTCYTGAFDDLSERNLAETMLFAENSGTMMFFGTSGLGWRENDVLLQLEIMDYFYRHPDLTIGEILSAAKVRYYAKYQGEVALSEIIQYNLFGDPATRIRMPDQKLSVALARSLIQRGDTLLVSAQMPFSQGNALCELADSTLFVVTQQPGTVRQNTAVISVAIPQDFRSNSGFVRVHACDDLGLQQAHGSAAFTLTEVFFDSARTENAGEDSLYYKVRVLSSAPLQRLICRSQNEQLLMVAMGADWYMSERGQKVADRLSYRFEALTATDRIVSSPVYSYIRPNQLKLEVHAQEWRWVGSERLFLQVPLYNWADGGGYALVVMEIQTSAKEWQEVGYDTVAVEPFSSTSARFAFSPAAGRIRVRFGCKPLFKADESFFYSSAWVDVNAFFISAQGGFLLDKGIQDTLIFDDHCRMVSLQGAGQRANVVTINKIYPVVVHEQPDFHSFSGMPAYHIAFANTDESINGIRLVMSLPSNNAEADSAFHHASIFRYIPQTRKWLRQTTGVESPNRLMVECSSGGTYTVLWAYDTQPPRIEIVVDGLQYAPNNYVSPQPQVMVMIQDLNGIDISSNSLQIHLNGRHSADVWALPDSIRNGNDLVIQGIPTLQAGMHQLLVTAADCNGNVLSPVEVTLRVAETFAINMLGNYPNPFKKETTFAYVLTQPAERISLKIYTAAGKLIRKLDGAGQEDDSPTAADYHELEWDGNDAQGHQVANGVYFYKLTAYRGNKTKEISGKIARLE